MSHKRRTLSIHANSTPWENSWFSWLSIPMITGSTKFTAFPRVTCSCSYWLELSILHKDIVCMYCYIFYSCGLGRSLASSPNLPSYSENGRSRWVEILADGAVGEICTGRVWVPVSPEDLGSGCIVSNGNYCKASRLSPSWYYSSRKLLLGQTLL